MDKYKALEYVENVLYILHKANGLDYYKLFKIMYFAQRKHLAQYGLCIFPDEFHALPNGPVPTMLYDAIKQSKPTPITTEWNKSVIKGTEDAHYILLPLRPANEDYISEAAKQTMDWAFNEYSTKNFMQLKEESHTPLWQKAYNAAHHEMSAYDIAKEAGADENALANILIAEEFNRAYQ